MSSVGILTQRKKRKMHDPSKEKLLKTIEIPDYEHEPDKGGSTIIRIIQ